MFTEEVLTRPRMQYKRCFARFVETEFVLLLFGMQYPDPLNISTNKGLNSRVLF